MEVLIKSVTKYFAKNYKILNNKFSIFLNKNIFEPNLTTILLIEMAKKLIKKKNQVLDLGCGSGVVGCYLYKKKFTNFIYGSDVSKAAVNCAIYNASKLTQKYDIRKSNLLNGWDVQKFDLIINDISGISSNLNGLSEWFKFAPNNSGKDGINHTIDILKNYKKNLKKNGSLIFPVLGLSNRKKLIIFLKREKIKYKILIKKSWPLPNKLRKHHKILYELKKQNIINYDEKFNLMHTTTEIFYCK